MAGSGKERWRRRSAGWGWAASVSINLRGDRLDLLREQLHPAVAEGRRHDRA